MAPKACELVLVTDIQVAGMNEEKVCVVVHERLLSLPEFEDPNEVPITDGLYFFYEDSEYSPHAYSGRIVRVGNHPRSDGRLVGRLWDHYRGGKNGSVFRRYLGGALMRDEDPQHPCLAPEPGKRPLGTTARKTLPSL